jgi:hypothetical protein
VIDEEQVRLEPDTTYEIMLRELYPTKSDLYERARILRAEHQRTQSAQRPQS